MSEDKHDADTISKKIAEVEAEMLKKLREAGPELEPLDDGTTQMIKEVNQIVQAERTLSTRLGRAPTPSEIANATGLSKARVNEVRRVTP